MEAGVKIAPHMKPALKLSAIILVVAIADILYVLFARRPLPWAAVIPAFIPLLTVVFVAIPMLKTKKS
jgi:hypothetical protein